MIAKVILGTMNNARKLVSIVEKIPYDAELCSGRYVVNAKSMLGVLSMPEFEVGELHIHTDEEIECSNILEKLLENGLLADTYDAAKRSLYDITTFGEILIDFTWQGVSDTGQTLFAQNPGGAPANVAVAAEKLGAHTAFIGKAGKDMHGEFLKSVLEKEKVDTKGMLLDENYFTTLAFVSVAENGERSFSFARKPGADTKIEKEEINVDILDKTTLFHVGSLSLTSISVGIAGIAPFFSTHRLATAFPNRTYSFNSFNVNSSGFFPDLLIRYKNPPQKESPAPFVSATLLTNPGICRPPSLQ